MTILFLHMGTKLKWAQSSAISNETLYMFAFAYTCNDVSIYYIIFPQLYTYKPGKKMQLRSYDVSKNSIDKSYAKTHLKMMMVMMMMMKCGGKRISLCSSLVILINYYHIDTSHAQYFGIFRTIAEYFFFFLSFWRRVNPVFHSLKIN